MAFILQNRVSNRNHEAHSNMGMRNGIDSQAGGNQFPFLSILILPLLTFQNFQNTPFK